MPFVNNGEAPSKDYPIILYLTAGTGQIASVGVRVFGEFPSTLIPQWYKPADQSSYEVSVGFRDPSAVCDPSFAPAETVGDRVIINPVSDRFKSPPPRTVHCHGRVCPDSALDSRKCRNAMVSCVYPCVQYRFLRSAPLAAMTHLIALTRVSPPRVLSVVAVGVRQDTAALPVPTLENDLVDAGW